MFGKEQGATADEDAAACEVVEYGPAHGGVSGGGGQVVGVRAEDAFEAAAAAPGCQGEEVAFPLEADDVGFWGEECLVGGA